MRWEELFADLEAQAAAEERAALESEIGDRTRLEAGRLHVVDRLRGAERAGSELVLTVRGAGRESGRVADVGRDWLLLAVGPEEVLVALAAVETVVGLGPEATEPDSEGAVAGRLGLGYVLRAIARDRSEVRLNTVSGAGLVGTVERVGADHLELTEHPPGEPRQRGARVLVPFSAVATVRVAS